MLDLDTYHFPAATNKAVENSLYPFLCSNHESSSTFITPDSALSGKLDYREHLQYFLYGAMIYMGLKKWNRALLFLETVIMAPATTNASKIQVEAYKKWVLVGLLHKGCVSEILLPDDVTQELWLTDMVLAPTNAKNDQLSGRKTIPCHRQAIRCTC